MKILSVFIIAFSVLFLYSQESSQRKEKAGKAVNAKTQQREQRRAERKKEKGKFDPSVPELKQETIDKTIDLVLNVFVKNTWSKDLKGYYKMKTDLKSNPCKITLVSLRIIAEQWKKIYVHPDTEETSQTRLIWFRDVGKAIVAFEPVAREFTEAASRRQEDRYLRAVESAKVLGKKVEEVIKKRRDKEYKISPKELTVIRKKNRERRLKAYQMKLESGKR